MPPGVGTGAVQRAIYRETRNCQPTSPQRYPCGGERCHQAEPQQCVAYCREVGATHELLHSLALDVAPEPLAPIGKPEGDSSLPLLPRKAVTLLAFTSHNRCHVKTAPFYSTLRDDSPRDRP